MKQQRNFLDLSWERVGEERREGREKGGVYIKKEENIINHKINQKKKEKRKERKYPSI